MLEEQEGETPITGVQRGTGSLLYYVIGVRGLCSTGLAHVNQRPSLTRGNFIVASSGLSPVSHQSHVYEQCHQEGTNALFFKAWSEVIYCMIYCHNSV